MADEQQANPPIAHQTRSKVAQASNRAEAGGGVEAAGEQRQPPKPKTTSRDLSSQMNKVPGKQAQSRKDKEVIIDDAP